MENRPHIDSLSPFIARKDVQGQLLSVLAPCPFYNFHDWLEEKHPGLLVKDLLKKALHGPLVNIDSTIKPCGHQRGLVVPRGERSRGGVT